MAYYIRAFCTSNDLPPLNAVVDYIQNQGVTVNIHEDFKDGDPASKNWEEVGLVYKKDKLPFLVEVNRDDGSNNCLYREEINEFKMLLQEINDSPEKKKILEHLSNSKYIIASQIPTADFDDDGYNANGFFLEYFVKNCGGMIQADGEGFYEGHNLIVELE
ncbi:MAG: hypothetical protein A3I29_04600 [Candidatus Magasanikbacteria bacterium RIFCSPLOWO2_02_FULL_44_11]|uniref:Uncharacterized protein n=1 Tax=Candidatus Magasanikbacteria bacterium RIFCSPLOWO2_02_FULL_44_11 TaxID=1798689 RepID=A0A1F6N9D9_9BACT|nr:MAG: hypothetical protein A3I29_04600 [Candidatus Magasanikbacteria bacterium RIFCSPLOWO2_02_FULL_44_11]